MSKYLLNCYFRAAEQFAENMVTNNAILWEINEIVGNLRPELSTHIRLIMLRAGLSRRWSRFLLNFCCRLSEMLANGNNTSKVQKGWRRSSQIQCDQEISWFKSLLRHLIRIPQRYRKFKSYYFLLHIRRWRLHHEV